MSLTFEVDTDYDDNKYESQITLIYKNEVCENNFRISNFDKLQYWDAIIKSINKGKRYSPNGTEDSTSFLYVENGFVGIENEGKDDDIGMLFKYDGQAFLPIALGIRQSLENNGHTE